MGGSGGCVAGGGTSRCGGELRCVAMVPVLPGLYLGCGLADAEEAWEGVVTALLLVDSEEPPAAVEGELEAVLRVPLLDEPCSDLLSHLDACAAFISRAREGGGAVLVRCHAGVSRSVAVVTAYLMKANNLPFEEAYAFVQSLRPEAKMNEGFEWQLKLYEKMGCEVDVTSALYKQYRLQKVTEKYPDEEDVHRGSAILQRPEALEQWMGGPPAPAKVVRERRRMQATNRRFQAEALVPSVCFGGQVR
ncbi:UNVERIFIED_CONTAM: hypothetical protein K2H54_020082 [Gekko kuhli]